jgi:hypothetical protein
MPHFLGRKEEINTTFFSELFGIEKIPFYVGAKISYLFYELLNGRSRNSTAIKE